VKYVCGANEGRQPERAKFTPFVLVADLHYSQWRKKALTIAAVFIGSFVVVFPGPLHAIFMNQFKCHLGAARGFVKQSIFRVPQVTDREFVADLGRSSRAAGPGLCCPFVR
jgi:hypothetical protein